MFEIVIRACFEVFWLGVVWNGFLLSKVRGHDVPCRFCGAPDGDGHLFWECTFPPLVEIRENPEFHDLMREEKAHWPRCLLRAGLTTVTFLSWMVNARTSSFIGRALAGIRNG